VFPGLTSQIYTAEILLTQPLLSSDLEQAWREAKGYAPAVRNFVASGGRYMGICLGAFLAGHNTGFGLIPVGDEIVREIDRSDAQVNSEEDTTIETDWTFSSYPKCGATEYGRWLYFQDGAAIRLSSKSTAKVLGRYSKNGDVAATLNSFGKGWVANIGPHPEADESWCKLHVDYSCAWFNEKN
jgi:hypothetical protein